MPSLPAFLDEDSVRTFLPHISARSVFLEPLHQLVRRINITADSHSEPGLFRAVQQDPWRESGKYALAWVYFFIFFLVVTFVLRVYHMWTDKIRRALHKEEAGKSSMTSSPDTDYEMANLATNRTTDRLFPRGPAPVSTNPDVESSLSVPSVNNLIARVRWLFYRPIPAIWVGKHAITFPSGGVIFVVSLGLVMCALYTFLPQPLFYDSIRYGSPPVAIRAGMLSVAMVPWIVALSMKANIVSFVTGIGHERLNVLHRWGGYICLALAIVHTVPFYVTPIWDEGAINVFKNYFQGQYYVYGTGIAALAPLGFLCVHSLPFLRHRLYELFVLLHVPASIAFIGMMFWHCNNYLTSWHYLFATVAIWLLSLFTRLAYLNWTKWWRLSWLCGEESTITLLPENAVKITVPSQVRWRPGQFVYIRIPGISVFENHPFTIASLCSDDFPSDYGDEYRDMILVFRPFGGFTRKCVNAALENGPYHTYRAFIDGPYGGMTRELASFDTVVLIAGGSGITAIVSHLLLLIKKMRDGTAVTKKIHVVWALKRPETAEWFKEELRICRQYAPPDSVQCQFFITAAKRYNPEKDGLAAINPHSRPVSNIVHERINDAFQGIASKRNSAIIRDWAEGDPEREKDVQSENQDAITSLPQAYLQPRHTPAPINVGPRSPLPPNHPPTPSGMSKSPRRPNFKLEIPTHQATSSFDFGFPRTPTEFQKNLMRFAFLPGAAKKDSWHTEYGRPDIPFMLRGFQREFGRRTAVFVCGPPSMRVDVQNTVARMQRQVLEDDGIDEIYLHSENYAL